MRTVYRLLGLVRRYGAGPVDTACARALELDVIAVAKIASMLERATEAQQPLLPVQPAAAVAGRFARDPAEFATKATSPATKGTSPSAPVLTLIRGGEAVATFHAEEITPAPAPAPTAPTATTPTTKETR
jgi:hypothetical protein